MKRLMLLAIVAWAAAPQVRADFIPIPAPTDAYVSSTTLYLISDPDFTNENSLNGAYGPLVFSLPVQVRTTPDTWFTWNSPPAVENANPRVLFANNGNTLDIALPAPAYTFGFEAQPEDFEVYNITADFYSGATLVGSISQDVNGFAGALLFAASTTDTPFTSVDIATDDIGFAIAQPRMYSTAPEPSYLPVLFAAFLILAVLRRCDPFAGAFKQ